MNWNLDFRPVTELDSTVPTPHPTPTGGNWSVFHPRENSSELLKRGSSERQCSERSMFGFDYIPLMLVSLAVPQFLPLYSEDSDSTYPMHWLRKIKCTVLIYSTVT